MGIEDGVVSGRSTEVLDFSYPYKGGAFAAAEEEETRGGERCVGACLLGLRALSVYDRHEVGVDGSDVRDSPKVYQVAWARGLAILTGGGSS